MLEEYYYFLTFDYMTESNPRFDQNEAYYIEHLKGKVDIETYGGVLKNNKKPMLQKFLDVLQKEAEAYMNPNDKMSLNKNLTFGDLAYILEGDKIEPILAVEIESDEKIGKFGGRRRVAKKQKSRRNKMSKSAKMSKRSKRSHTRRR